MKRVVLAAALVWVFVVSQADAYACYVAIPEVPEAFERAGAVFIGEVVRITKPLASEPNAPLADRFHRVTFKVEQSWKGAGFQEFVVPELVVLSAQTMKGECFAWGSFIEGRKYLVYADKTAGNDLVVHFANRTVSLFSASEDIKELERISSPFYKYKYQRRSLDVVFPITRVNPIVRP